jgi:PAS domain S-box-containing protein
MPAVELQYRIHQQTVLSEFGVLAVQTRDFETLLRRATELCASGMRSRLCKVLEYQPLTDRLLVRAGVGWGAGVVGRATVGADLESPAGFALKTGRSVISNHLSEESRFRTPELLAAHGVRRAINVIISGGEAFGVLEIDSDMPGQFDEADLAFMQGFANLIGVAVERQKLESERDEAVRSLVLERERARANEEQLRRVIEGVRDHAIITIADDRTVTGWSTGAEAIFGWSAEEVVGRPVDLLFTPEDRAQSIPEKELATARTEGVAPDERWQLRKDGARIWTSGNVRTLTDSHGSARGFVKIAKDETERRHNEVLLRERAEHQEVLTREVSHRVKNSLQLVSGLLALQARATANENARQALDTAAARVTTISEVHDQLWRRGEAATVDLCVFLEDLCSRLQATAPHHSLLFDRQSPSILVSTDQAAPIGLIVNELITNAVKYAYPGIDSRGEVRVVVGGASDRAVWVEVSDRGAGLPDGFDLESQSSTSLGARLVTSLARQITGTVSVQTGAQGTRFVVEFPAKLSDT